MKKGSLIVIAILLTVFAFIGIQGNRYLSCESPVVIDLFGNGSEARINEIVLALGGLPKSNIDDLGLVMNRWGGELTMKEESGIAIPPIYLVEAWQIEPSSVSATQFSYYGPLNDSSKYSYRFNILVTYADRDTAVLQYSSWGYGTVACPILISTGIGPPGQLKIMP